MLASLLDGSSAAVVVAGAASLVGAALAWLASWLTASVKKTTAEARETTAEAKHAHNLPSMAADIEALLAFKQQLEDDAADEKQREHDAALARIAELEAEADARDRRELEDSSPLSMSGVRTTQPLRRGK